MDIQSATYRGYRRQALYVLWRLLTDEDGHSRLYRPEGEEDLAVLDLKETLLEAVQVKDYSAPLSLSDLKPRSPDGFFARMKQRLHDHPGCRHILASFGRIGPELTYAIAAQGSLRNTVAARLHDRNPTITLAEGERLLGELNDNLQFLDESTMSADIKAALADTMAGGHYESTMNLLMYWVFESAERKSVLTRASLIKQITRIAEYLGVLRDHNREWMTVIRPLENKALSQDEFDRLREEYRRGAQARWEHILADLDHPRKARLSELHKKISRRSVVVVRGASGQGKSSLAFRYMQDYVPDGLRFNVCVVEDRLHALSIANALRGHVARLQLRAVVLIDLSPIDAGWVDLARELVRGGMKVLVTVREEDFHRAASIVSDLEYEEVVLDSLTKDEAEPIFKSLTAGERLPSTLDFEDIWCRFTLTETGPLMEFTHLITEGRTLTEKISGQIVRLQKESNDFRCINGITAAHLRLLALAAIGNAAECRMSLKSMCGQCGLDPLTNPLAPFEGEFLLRQAEYGGKTVVVGLHPLRSKAVVSALFAGCEEDWGRYAASCLEHVLDEDIERFMLHSFLGHPACSVSLEAAVHELKLRSWTQAGGLARALVWEGVNRYERENHEQLEAAVAKHDTAWWFLCDSLVGLERVNIIERRREMEEISQRELPWFELTDKKRVFDPLRGWAQQITPPSGQPSSALDWIMLGELAYWIGSNSISGLLHRALLDVLPTVLPTNLTIEELGLFISGRYHMRDSAFLDWHAQKCAELSARFLRETNSTYLVDQADEVKVYFPVFSTHHSTNNGSDDSDLHAAAVRRIDLLRKLFPQRATYGSQGLGIEAVSAFYPHDPTYKAIPAKNLPPERGVRLNRIFLNLVAFRLQRADSWRSYAEAHFQLRSSICACFRALYRAWELLLDRATDRSRVARKLPIEEVNQVSQQSKMPMLPCNAVDEWGFASELQGTATDEMGGAPVDGRVPHIAVRGSLKRFQPWHEIWRDYESSARNVVSGIGDTTASLLNGEEPAGHDSRSPDRGRLLLYNLARAWEALTGMQREYGHWFGVHEDRGKLAELQDHEARTYRHLWAIASEVIYPRVKDSQHSISGIEREISVRRRNFLASLSRELSAVLVGVGSHRIECGPLNIDGKRCLVVVCDHESAASMEAQREAVVLAIWRATRNGGWRPLEWTPISVEWPHVFVTHILRGRALASAGTFLSSFVLFGIEKDFEIKAHHLADQPVPERDYLATGVILWELPVLSGLGAFVGSVSAFMLTVMQAYSILALAQEKGLSSEDLEAGLESYGSEVRLLRETVVNAFEELKGLMQGMDAQKGLEQLRGTEWSLRLESLCRAPLLLPPFEDDRAIVTVAGLAEWLEQCERSLSGIRTLGQEVADLATKRSA